MKSISFLLMFFALTVGVQADEIIHDAETRLLQKAHGIEWAREDADLDKRLAALEKRFGTKPNLVHVMWDDAGYGQLGHPLFSKMHGLETPRIEQLAREGMSFVRMYSEIACTQTRAAAQTGRLAVRNGMLKVAFPPEGYGLSGKEETIAEVLSGAGYATAFYGKWHLGDIRESYPHNQGYDETLFMPYNQWPPMMFNKGGEEMGLTIGYSDDFIETKFQKDKSFRFYDWVFGVEGTRGGKTREFVKGDHDGYDRFNAEIRKRAKDFIRKNARASKPFLLSYYTNTPHDYGRHEDLEAVGRGGKYASGMAKFDREVGELIDLLRAEGVAENTLVVLMADNGPMEEIKPTVSLNTLFRGGKGDFLEGGVRVPAFAWWPGMIAEQSFVNDIVHVTDLFTTFARLAGATDRIPGDRVIDGVDQSALLLNGETHGRRDHIQIYRGPNLSATVKENYKRHWEADRPGLLGTDMYDLYRDPREEHPMMAQMLWAWTAFDTIKKRHLAQVKKYPHTPMTHGAVMGGMVPLGKDEK